MGENDPSDVIEEHLDRGMATLDAVRTKEGGVGDSIEPAENGNTTACI